MAENSRQINYGEVFFVKVGDEFVAIGRLVGKQSELVNGKEVTTAFVECYK